MIQQIWTSLLIQHTECVICSLICGTSLTLLALGEGENNYLVMWVGQCCDTLRGGLVSWPPPCSGSHSEGWKQCRDVSSMLLLPFELAPRARGKDSLHSELWSHAKLSIHPPLGIPLGQWNGNMVDSLIDWQFIKAKPCDLTFQFLPALLFLLTVSPNNIFCYSGHVSLSEPPQWIMEGKKEEEESWAFFILKQHLIVIYNVRKG